MECCHRLSLQRCVSGIAKRKNRGRRKFPHPLQSSPNYEVVEVSVGLGDGAGESNQSQGSDSRLQTSARTTFCPDRYSECENPDYLRAALKISFACPSQTPSLTEPEQVVISAKKQFSVCRCTAEACA